MWEQSHQSLKQNFGICEVVPFLQVASVTGMPLWIECSGVLHSIVMHGWLMRLRWVIRGGRGPRKRYMWKWRNQEGICPTEKKNGNWTTSKEFFYISRKNFLYLKSDRRKFWFSLSKWRNGTVCVPIGCNTEAIRLQWNALLVRPHM